MATKIIQVPMDERLLRAVTRSAKERQSTRAALIREACNDYLQRLSEEALERKYVEGYRRKPESPAVGKVGVKLAATVWPKEDWS